MLDTLDSILYDESMTRNEKLAYLRRRKAELEGFREPTPGIIEAHTRVTALLLDILQEGQEDAVE